MALLVAKMDIASDSDSEERGFESLRAGQILKKGDIFMGAVAIIKSLCWIAVAATHFLGRTWDSVEKLVDSAKSNTAVCVDYFKNPKLDNKSKPDVDAADSKSSPADSADKTYVSVRGSDKRVGRFKVAKSMCTAVNDVVDVSGKVLLDVYLTGLGLVQNKDGTMWYWPWCVFHDKCHIKPKEVNLKALAEAFKQLEQDGVIAGGKFSQDGFNAKWPKKIEIVK